MKLIFNKYTCLGNHFVVFDERECGRVQNPSELAKWAGDPFCGVGADSVLFVGGDSSGLADHTARFFDPTGEEFLCCGNGLLSLALHLFRLRGVRDSMILTQLPLGAGVSCPLRHNPNTGLSEVELRYEAQTMKRFLAVGEPGSTHGCWRIELRIPNLNIEASGVALYTGEPHLVIFQSPMRSHWEVDSAAIYAFGGSAEFLQAIGDHLNIFAQVQFPLGVNVSLARLVVGSLLEYRTYERGIRRQTLACGTGALAVVKARESIFSAGSMSWTLNPLEARRHPAFSSESLTISQSSLCGTPRWVFSGQADWRQR